MQLCSAALCGFPENIHDAGTSPHLQLHSAGIQLQPALQRQIGFSKITSFGEDFFLPLQKRHFFKEERGMTLDWSCQVLKGSRQGLSTLSIVLLQHLVNMQYPAGFNSVKKKVLAGQAPSCFHREAIRNSTEITIFITTHFTNSNHLKIRKPRYWFYFVFLFFEQKILGRKLVRCCKTRRWLNSPPKSNMNLLVQVMCVCSQYDAVQRGVPCLGSRVGGKGQICKAVVYSGIGTKTTLRSTGAGMTVFSFKSMFSIHHIILFNY